MQQLATRVAFRGTLTLALSIFRCNNCAVLIRCDVKYDTHQVKAIDTLLQQIELEIQTTDTHAIQRQFLHVPRFVFYSKTSGLHPPIDGFVESAEICQ